MRLLLSLVALAFAPAVVVFGQATECKAPGTSVEKEIVNTRNGWYAAYFRGDTSAMDQIETADFLVVSNGGTQSKERQITGIQKAVKEHNWMPEGMTHVDENMTVRLFGDTAIISLLSWNKKPGQQNVLPGGKFAITEVWVKRDGRWRVAHLHFSPLETSPTTGAVPQKK